MKGREGAQRRQKSDDIDTHCGILEARVPPTPFDSQDWGASLRRGRLVARVPFLATRAPQRTVHDKCQTKSFLV